MIGSGPRFSIFYGALFFAAGVQLPFWPLWLSGRGLPVEEVGILLAAGTWARVALAPLFGQLADRTQAIKALLLTCALSSTLVLLFMPLASGFWLLLALQIPAYALTQPLLPLGESQAMQAVKRGEMDYGRVRLWGSLTFILAVVVAGKLTTLSGSDVILWLLVGGMLATAATIPFLPTAPRATRPSTAPARLLSDRGFLLFLGTAALLQASHAVYYAYSALHWKAAGLSETLVGLLWAAGVIAEVLLFYLARPLIERLRPTSLLALAAVGGLLRWSLLAMTTSPFLLLGGQLLHAVTFGAAHLGAMFWIAGRIDASRAAGAQSLLAAAVGGAMGLMTLLAAPLFERVGGAAFLAMTGVSALALILAWALRRRRDAYLVP